MYPKIKSAKRAVKAMNQKSTTRNKLEHYSCKFCGQWHIGRINTYRKRQQKIN